MKNSFFIKKCIENFVDYGLLSIFKKILRMHNAYEWQLVPYQ